MPNTFVTTLEINEQEQRKLGKIAENLNSVSDFLSEIINAFKGTDLVKIIDGVLPWAGVVGESLSEAAPPIKFLATLLKKAASIKDLNKLAHLACTLAYQRSVEQAIKVIGPPEKPAISQKQKEIDLAEEVELPSTLDNFDRFEFSNALLHPFITTSDKILMLFSNKVGYNEIETRYLINEIHQRFVVNLKTLISHGSTADKFKAFSTRLQLGTNESIAMSALAEHADYQRYLFEEKPVFGKEPFTLSHVFIDVECGKLEWGVIRDGISGCEKEGNINEREQIDPFSDKYGKRFPLSKTVLDLIGDSKFNDAIIIQGTAGSGKSAFTLWLSALLVKSGLRPIRIMFRDIRFDRTLPVIEAIGKSLRYTDSDRSPSGLNYPKPDDPLQNGKIFKEQIRFGSANICPYVLIFDGWDEISISSSEGFKVRLDRLLEQIRGEFLSQASTVPVRVILTGRPSVAISETPFLKKKTPILTIRPLNPHQLKAFIENIAKICNKPPLKGESLTLWKLFEIDRLDNVLKKYERDFNKLTENASNKEQSESRQDSQMEGFGSLEVLGLPLLAHLSTRLFAEINGPVDHLIENPTALYRNLVDLTCGKAGKYSGSQEDTEEGYFRYYGGTLRDLLRRTAAAMTTFSHENITFEELQLRLRQSHPDLQKNVEKETSDNPLSQLLISYYFKGGHADLGCEFLHKSFREYLFAEGIIELLKGYGRKNARKHFQERELYWKDFAEHDPRYNLCRNLGILLGPVWLTREISGYIQELLWWEIERSFSSIKESISENAFPTEALEPQEWEFIRDALADVWDWWAEGVHMRPQPSYDKKGNIVFDTHAFAEEIVEFSVPQATERDDPLPAVKRTITIDSHLGDGLFQLCSHLHFNIARQQGWGLHKNGTVMKPMEMWANISDTGNGPRRCQTIVQPQKQSFILFNPSGTSPDFFKNYVARINAAGGRWMGPFPLGLSVNGVDLRNTAIVISIPRFQPVYIVDWNFSNLNEAEIAGTLLYQHQMEHIFGKKIWGWLSLLGSANLRGADLSEANLRKACLSDANLSDANLKRAVFRAADLTGAAFRNANLSDADFRGANATGAIFTGADLTGADFRNANLSDADFGDANSTGADLTGADFRGANLMGADLTGVNLTRADFRDVNLTGAKTDINK